MVFIFWQGIISIHQKSFLEALSRQPSVSKVLLAVESKITPYRTNMGWDVPEIENVEIILSPAKQEIHRIVKEHKDAVHVVGGIKAGRMVSMAFDVCIKQNCKMGIMTEPYNHAGLKGWLRAFKYRYYRAKYNRHIQFILTIGEKGRMQFANLGFDTQKLFPWAYFISFGNTNKKKDKQAREIRIIYAGRLEEAKGIYKFANQLADADSQNYKFDIYGEGPDGEKLKQLVAAKGLDGKVTFYPFLEHAELLKKYPGYDWVVLPSAGKDGWGVIVSEGLLNGLKAICSNICGAAGVIKPGFNGIVFDWSKKGSCKNAINKMLQDTNFADTGTISAWANQAISAQAGAGYFLKIVACVYEKGQKPEAPWVL